jgi:glycosyltransferase involved in cell wall biosynthesis
MAAGKPVIVPDVAAMPETMGSAGLAYRSGDMAGLVDKILSLAHDKALYASLCSKAPENAVKFDMAKTLGKYVDMCSKLVETRGR